MFRFGSHRSIVKTLPVQLLYKPGHKEPPRTRVLFRRRAEDIPTALSPLFGFLQSSCYIKCRLSHVKITLMPTPHRPSIAVRRSLRKLGQDLRDARRRRRLPAAVVAERAFTSRPSLQRVEEGDPAVSIGIYAAVLQALGLLDGLGQLADPSRDAVGLALDSEKLPKRVRLPKTSASDKHNA
jgi:hypothetical protein